MKMKIVFAFDYPKKNESAHPAFSSAVRCSIRILIEQTAEKSHMTIDHDTIRKRPTDRGGRPASVKATEDDGRAGVLRIDFGPMDGLGSVDWDEFFQKFDEADLALLYQDRARDGKVSRFHKFVGRSSH